MNYNLDMRHAWYLDFLILLLLTLTACTDPQPAPPSSPLPLITSSPSPSLHPPNPQTLVRVLNHAISLERDAWEQFDYPTFHGDFLTSPHARALFDFVQADFDRYYRHGIPQAGEMFTERSLDPNIWFPPRGVWTLAQAGIVELLNTMGITLTSEKTFTLDPFILTPTSIEMDGDPSTEWLVEVRSDTYNLHGWLPLDANDGYTLISNEIQHENLARAGGTTLHIIPDLNGDGLSDLLVHFDGLVVGTQFGYLKVYGLVGERIALLDTIQLKAGEAFEINANEIRVKIPRSLNFECVWTQTNLYQWKGNEKVYSSLDDAPPDLPFCNAALALSPLSNLNPNERAAFLEKALTEITSATAPSDDYLALLYLHLQMAYKAQAVEANVFSRSDFNSLQGIFAEYIQVLAGSESAWLLCNRLYREARGGTLNVGELAVYFNPAALFSAYGDVIPSPAPLICPLEMLVDDNLKILLLPANVPPGEHLSEINAFLEQLSAYAIDQDAEEEWIGLLNLETPRVLLFDQVGAHWVIYTLAQFGAPVSQFQIAVKDFNADNHQDILLLATLDDSVPVSQYPACWEVASAQVNELVIISSENLDAGKNIVLCGEPPVLTSIPHEELQQFVTEKPPQLPTLEDSPAFYSFLEEQEGQILASSSFPNVRSVLQDILHESTWDFPGVERVLPRVLFDIGLSYELEGDAEAARAAYLDLIAQWPDSPWAWLAEARVSD